SHDVEAKDIWRMCQTKDIAVRDWVKLGVTRARATGAPAVFWLDRNRAHDAELIKKVDLELGQLDTDGLEIRIMSPAEATEFSLERIQKGEDTISVTGNVLRDYLTDLFPILELGTSAKMLSIVPLLEGGGLFETGAGGSAPKHVEQLMSENHLRWDSLGEFLALAVSLDDLSEKSGNKRAKVLAQALDTANEKYLLNNKAPSRKAGEIDNRGTHFYVFLYWAQALATQSEDADLKAKFEGIAAKLESCEAQIMEELNAVQGRAADIGGYYKPDEEKVAKVMRPSSTLNSIVAEVNA
ncbi:MAG: NADP-dependent isocitrate dehydrogenase, partial [Pseudomonadota bacterium]